jgi:hypothetical protein
METVRTTGKILPTHMKCVMNKVTKCEHVRHPPFTDTPTILAAGKQPALISLLCVTTFTWLLSAALIAIKFVSSRFIAMMIPTHITTTFPF